MKKNSRILIVRSEYNDTTDMEVIANKAIDKNKELERSTIVVKGAFEIPVTIAKNINNYDGFIAIGIIIKGETTNFSLISQAITNGIMSLSISSKKPIGNAILTCLTKKQAAERIAKGEEAANAVIDILKQN
tara:strand:- start:448 stop:843 length:396 start_codon:yes stop_codon:yes gene_type:complete